MSWHWDLVTHGVTTLGQVPSGLPSFGIPDVTWGDVPQYFGIVGRDVPRDPGAERGDRHARTPRSTRSRSTRTSTSSGSASRTLSAGLSGTFVVNGSPTKTQMVDGAGGRSQLATLTTAFVVLVVLLFLTVPLQYLPNAVLSSVVFLIGIELVDIAGMRGSSRVRFDEFVVAADHGGHRCGRRRRAGGRARGRSSRSSTTSAAAIARTTPSSCAVPKGTELVKPAPGSRTLPGLVIYRFGAGLYYANASRFAEEVLEIMTTGDPVEWFCIDAEAIDDVDYSGSKTLFETHATSEPARHAAPVRAGCRTTFARASIATASPISSVPMVTTGTSPT